MADGELYKEVRGILCNHDNRGYETVEKLEKYPAHAIHAIGG